MITFNILVFNVYIISPILVVPTWIQFRISVHMVRHQMAVSSRISWPRVTQSYLWLRNQKTKVLLIQTVHWSGKQEHPWRLLLPLPTRYWLGKIVPSLLIFAGTHQPSLVFYTGNTSRTANFGRNIARHHILSASTALLIPVGFCWRLFYFTLESRFIIVSSWPQPSTIFILMIIAGIFWSKQFSSAWHSR